MESQPQNPEFRNPENRENIHLCMSTKNRLNCSSWQHEH